MRSGRILIILGLLLGLITAAVTFMTLSQSSPSQQTQVATRNVVVASQNIDPRTEITLDKITTAGFPVEAIPADSADSLEAVAGKLALIPIYQGQIILSRMIANKPAPIITPTGSIASFMIPEGKVAMAFEISNINGVAGAIQPGDTVDIIVTLEANALPATSRPGAAPTGTEGLPVTQLTLQNVLVLHVGPWGTQDRNAPPGGTLTFVLNRQDAAVLKSLREQGQVDLVLRRVGDDKIYNIEPVNLQYLNLRFKFNLIPGAAGR